MDNITHIRHSRSWLPPQLRILVAYRDLLRSLIKRDVSLRYRQTLLGPAWIVVQPLMTAAIFTFVFGSVAKVPIPKDVPYFVFAIMGMGLWTGFSQCLTRSTSSVLANIDLVTKVYFPRLLLPVSAAAAAAVDSSLMIGVACSILLLSGLGINSAALLVPALLLGVLFLAMCVGAALGALLVRARDVQYGVPILVQGLLFATPVLYPLQSIPESVRPLSAANPLTFYFEALRWATFGTPAPSASLVVSSLCVTGALGLAGVCVFSRLERDFADVI